MEDLWYIGSPFSQKVLFLKGYGRCAYCICHLLAILTLICLGRWRDGRHAKDDWEGSPLRVCPLLAVQNAYCFCLMLLSIAIADKLLMALLVPKDAQLTALILVFLFGTGINHFLCYLLWHVFWHLELVYKTRHGRNFQNWV